jgi:hypothetical protein
MLKIKSNRCPFNTMKLTLNNGELKKRFKKKDIVT